MEKTLCINGTVDNPLVGADADFFADQIVNATVPVDRNYDEKQQKYNSEEIGRWWGSLALDAEFQNSVKPKQAVEAAFNVNVLYEYCDYLKRHETRNIELEYKRFPVVLGQVFAVSN